MSDLEIPLNGIDIHVGGRLRARRLLIRMSEGWLAGFLGISENKLAEIEEGRARIGYEDLLKVADIIGVPERYFYQGHGKDDTPEPPDGQRSSWVRDVDRWFRDHVSPHEGIFLKVAKRLIGNIDTARDLVHDAYAAILADDRWRRVENPKAYVNRTVANLALDLIKRNRIVPINEYAEVETLGHMDPAPDAYHNVADRESLAAVLAALEKLPPQTRQVFVLRRVDNLAPKEIAARLGISLGTVEWHITQGIAGLQRHLESHRKAIDLKVWLANQQFETDRKAVREPKP